MLKQVVFLIAMLPAATGVPVTGAVVQEGASSVAVVPRQAAVQRAINRGTALPRRRRSTGRSSSDKVSDATILLAGDYLRDYSNGKRSSPDARRAWEEFHGWCGQTIARFAGRLGLRGADLDDCSQEVWGDLLRNFKTFELDRSRGQFSSWLYAIVRNKAADLVRRRARQPAEALSLAAASSLTSTEEDPAGQCEKSDERALVRQAMTKLRSVVSEQSYRVLHLRWIEQLDAAEVASRLGITSEQVWVREHRMKRKLREILENDLGNRIERANQSDDASTAVAGQIA